MQPQGRPSSHDSTLQARESQVADAPNIYNYGQAAEPEEFGYELRLLLLSPVGAEGKSRGEWPRGHNATPGGRRNTNGDRRGAIYYSGTQPMIQSQDAFGKNSAFWPCLSTFARSLFVLTKKLPRQPARVACKHEPRWEHHLVPEGQWKWLRFQQFLEIDAGRGHTNKAIDGQGRSERIICFF